MDKKENEKMREKIIKKNLQQKKIIKETKISNKNLFCSRT